MSSVYPPRYNLVNELLSFSPVLDNLGGLKFLVLINENVSDPEESLLEGSYGVLLAASTNDSDIAAMSIKNYGVVMVSTYFIVFCEFVFKALSISYVFELSFILVIFKSSSLDMLK